LPRRQERASRNLRDGFRVAIAAAVFFLPQVLDAGDDDFWYTRKHGTGDWDGLRQKWLEVGVVPGGFYVFDILGNPAGGLSQETAYAGLAQFDLSLNLSRLLGAKGLAFNIAFSWSSGSNLSNSVGNVFQVGEAYSGRTVQLSRLYLEQTLADGKLFLKVGRISAGNDFAVLPVNVYHVNAAINGNPLSIPLNSPGFFTDPVGQWGLRFLVKPSKFLQVRVGAYNADPAVGEEDKHGFDFSLNPQNGVLSMAEVTFAPRIRAGGDEYRGRYKIGAYYDSSTFGYVDDPSLTRDGQYGYFLMGQQELLHEAGGATELEFRPFFGRHIVRTEVQFDAPISRQGLISWCAVAVSPRDEISPMPLYLAGGMLYRGLFKHRGNDIAGLAVYHGRFSDQFPDRKPEMAVETNYAIQATPWFYVTPNLQYVINPGGTDTPNAFVCGLEVGITF
jgi:porin